MESLLITPQRCSELLSLSRSTVYALMAAGEIEFLKVGRSRRVRPESLVRFIEERATAEEVRSA